MSQSISKVRAPKGYTFRIKKMSNHYTQVALFLSSTIDKKIGQVNLIKVRPGYYETHSYLEEDYHNKGLGALLYARAIQHALQNGWRVRSSGNSSSEAQRVWKGKTIRKYFSIKLKKAKDRDYDKWYAYAK